MITLYHIVMKVVSQVFSTEVTSVSVEDSKEAHLWPFTFPVLVLRFEYI